MRRFLTYILLIALTLQSFYRVVMTLDYQIHLPTYLAECINKDKPQLHCNGQCVLMQKIKEREKQESKSKLANYEYSSLYMHREQILLQPFTILEEQEVKPESRYVISLYSQPIDGIFRPPIV